MSSPIRPTGQPIEFLDRRALLKRVGAAGMAAMGSPLLPWARGEEVAPASVPGKKLVRFPEKTDLILLTDRPPNLETPLQYFRDDLTPNEAFFVRWHLGMVPTRVDTKAFRLTLNGHVQSELSLSLEALKRDFEPVSVVAVCQCSGNGRGLFMPRVTGGQWGNGATGNAKWTGVRLADLLKKAAPRAGSVDVTFGGLDKSPLPTVPAFIKSLLVGHEKVAETIVAYAMNDQPLPMLNGFPLRLIVPGWYATYWVKSLHKIEVTDKPFDGFWMSKAYRTPNTPDMVEKPAELAKETVPITDMTCRSILVTPEEGQTVMAGQPCEVTGVAMDSGKGIKEVLVSVDAGKTWKLATLDKDLGKYSWRRFRFQFTPAAGNYTLMARATNVAGQTQTTEQWNRVGYGRNLVESVHVTAK